MPTVRSVQPAQQAHIRDNALPLLKLLHTPPIPAAKIQNLAEPCYACCNNPLHLVQIPPTGVQTLDNLVQS